MLSKKETELVAYGVAAQTLMMHLLVRTAKIGKLEAADVLEIIDAARRTLEAELEENPVMPKAMDIVLSLLAQIGGEAERRGGASH